MTVDLVIPESDPVAENDNTQDINGRASVSGLQDAVTIAAELYGLVGSLIPIHLHIRRPLGKAVPSRLSSRLSVN